MDASKKWNVLITPASLEFRGTWLTAQAGSCLGLCSHLCAKRLVLRLHPLVSCKKFNMLPLGHMPPHQPTFLHALTPSLLPNHLCFGFRLFYLL